MENDNILHLLQLSIVGVLADTVFQLGKEGIIEKVTERKKKEQMLSGKKNAEFYGMASAEGVFNRLSEIFNCANWKIQREATGFSAEASTCRLYSLAKKRGAPSPCNIYCLNPLEGMIKGLNRNLQFNVKETLWEGKRCRIKVVE